MKYAGDSLAKQFARWFFWGANKSYLRSVRPNMRGLDEGSHDPIVVLASSEGGDVSLLSNLGFVKKQIVAVDIDQRAIDACAERHADKAIFICGDVAEVCSTYDLAPKAALLDFCATASPRALKAVISVVHRMPPGSNIGVVFSMGHEMPSWKVDLCYLDDFISSKVDHAVSSWREMGLQEAELRARSKEFSLLLTHQIKTGRGLDIYGTGNDRVFPGLSIVGQLGSLRKKIFYSPSKAIKDVDWDCLKRRSEGAESEASMRRVVAFGEMLDVVLALRGLQTRRIFSCRYVGHRTPMIMVSLEIVHQRKLANIFDPIPLADHFHLPNDLGEADIRKIFDENPEEAVSFFQIPSEKLAAWKAVATRKRNAQEK